MLLHYEELGLFLLVALIVLLGVILWSLCAPGPSYQPVYEILESNSIAQSRDAELVDCFKSLFRGFDLRNKGFGSALNSLKASASTSIKTDSFHKPMVVYVYMRSYDLFEEFQKLLAKQMRDVDVRAGLPMAPTRSFTQSIDHASMSKDGIILYTVDASAMGAHAVDAASDDQDDFTRLMLEYPNYHVVHTLLTSPDNHGRDIINSPLLEWIQEKNISSLVFECASYTTDLSSQESFVRLQTLVGGDLSNRG